MPKFNLLSNQSQEVKTDPKLTARKKTPSCLDPGAAEYKVPEVEQNGLCWKEYATYVERKFDSLAADVKKREELKGDKK